jgi:hypothetical protein
VRSLILAGRTVFIHNKFSARMDKTTVPEDLVTRFTRDTQLFG